MAEDTLIEFICRDPMGVVVTCLNTQWQYIIKHKEMEGQQGVARAIIESPEFINRSKNFKNRQCYYKQLVMAGIGSTYLRVVVKLGSKPFGPKRGYMVNAFACKGPQEGEILIWEKS
jgi:hypothetical protein